MYIIVIESPPGVFSYAPMPKTVDMTSGDFGDWSQIIRPKFRILVVLNLA